MKKHPTLTKEESELLAMYWPSDISDKDYFDMVRHVYEKARKREESNREASNDD